MKKNIIFAMASLCGALLWACSDDSPSQPELHSSLVCSSQEKCSDVTLQEGLALIRSSGKFAEMGTNSNSAKPSERPQMDAKFAYDFQIGKHEVTCGEFNALMDKKNGVKLSCENENLPAVNVTYYDAALYANAKSKAAGMDTAYVYSSVEYDKNGHCVLLNGLVFKPEVNAFRLPTEAEWIYAAGLSFDVDNSWNASNSGSKVHEVCSKKNENGLCDFLGNVTEWVNDWHGYFRDTSITNYVGGVDGGSLGERVIKGGSYRTEASSINLYARGDVYTVTGTSAADYLGLRLAYGKIENPVWLDASGTAVVSNLSIVASTKNISTLFGIYKSKLAFRNNNSGNLAFVDFRIISPSIIEIKDSIDVYHPDISPDGKRVAFCTGLEGQSGSSSVYVRELNAEGSNLVKLNVKNAAIPRWRVLENGDTVIVYVSDAGNNKEESVFKSASTWQVKFANGKFGEPQKMFDGAYHGGISDDESLAVTGARVLRARIATKGSTVKSKAKDTLWYNGDQACNASLNKKTKRTLFLDFAKSDGETMGAKFVGSKYRTHERLLIADNEGKLVSTVAAPSGYTFDHSEWVLNDENVAVATLTNADGAHQKIVLVDTKDGALTTLVEGDDVWHPCFWVSTGISSESSDWNADSVGVYVSAKNQTDYLLSHKMPLFWKLKDSVELIGLGNSRMWAGFDPLEMSVSSMNMGFYPCDMHCQHYFFKNYVLNHGSNVKYVVVGLDFDLWFNYDERTDIEWDMGEALGFKYDISHEFYPDGVDETFVKMVIENAPDDVDSIITKRGWNEISFSIGWNNADGLATMNGDSTWSDCLFNKNLANCLVDSDLNTCTSKYHINVCVADTSLSKCLANHELTQCSSIFGGNMDKLKDLVRLAKERNIFVIGVIFPMSPNYKNTGAYGRHGMLRSHAIKLFEEFKTWAEGRSNFVYLDENKFGDHDYPSSMSLDSDHLNRDGAKRFTAKLDSLLKSVR